MVSTKRQLFSGLIGLLGFPSAASARSAGQGNEAPADDAAKLATPAIVKAVADRLGYTMPALHGGGPSVSAARNDRAFAEMIATGLPCRLPPETFRVSQPVDARRDGQVLRGASKLHTLILQTTPNVPVLRIGRQCCDIGSLQVAYETEQPQANDGAMGVAMSKLYKSRVSDLLINRAAIGIGIDPQGYDNSFGDYRDPNPRHNWEFDNVFDGVTCQRFSRQGRYLDCVIGGSTGSTWSNTRIEGGTTNPADPDSLEGDFVSNYLGMVDNGLRIEHFNPRNKVIYNAANVRRTINGLHIEGWGTSHHAIPVLYAGENSGVIVNDVSLTFCAIRHNVALFELADGAAVQVASVFEDANAFAPARRMRLHAADDSARLEVFGVRASSGNLAIDTRSGLRRYEDFLFRNGQVREGYGQASRPQAAMPPPFASSANALDADWVGAPLPWEPGDRCSNTAPSRGGTTGWCCTRRGAPAEWQAEANLAR